MKILCLGNEFIEEDSFAKEIGKKLIKKGFNVVDIKDSFQLMEELKKDEESFILDIVQNLQDVRLIDIADLERNKIMTAHDFDAGFVLKLIGEDKDIKIIGIPMKGEENFAKMAKFSREPFENSFNNVKKMNYSKSSEVNSILEKILDIFEGFE